MDISLGISSRALDYVRSRAENIMQATCRIERVLKPTFDQSTGNATAGGRQTIYEGPCRIWEVSGGNVVMVGEDEVSMQNTQLSIPWDVDPVPIKYDQVQILAHNTDDSLIGKRFEILSGAKAGELRATRRFAIQGYQR